MGSRPKTRKQHVNEPKAKEQNTTYKWTPCQRQHVSERLAKDQHAPDWWKCLAKDQHATISACLCHQTDEFSISSCCHSACENECAGKCQEMLQSVSHSLAAAWNTASTLELDIWLGDKKIKSSCLLGDSGGVVNSLDFCPASLKSLWYFYFRRVLSSQWKAVTLNLRILHCQH